MCAHCNCMAGADEACSHIAASLHTTWTGVGMQQEKAIIPERYRWLEATELVCILATIVPSPFRLHFACITDPICEA